MTEEFMDIVESEQKLAFQEPLGPTPEVDDGVPSSFLDAIHKVADERGKQVAEQADVKYYGVILQKEGQLWAKDKSLERKNQRHKFTKSLIYVASILLAVVLAYAYFTRLSPPLPPLAVVLLILMTAQFGPRIWEETTVYRDHLTMSLSEQYYRLRERGAKLKRSLKENPHELH